MYFDIIHIYVRAVEIIPLHKYESNNIIINCMNDEKEAARNVGKEKFVFVFVYPHLCHFLANIFVQTV